MAYNLETLLAEKFETVISRGITNSRMRDFYDIYILTNTKDYNINIFKEALKNTARKRKTERQMDDFVNIIERIAFDKDMITLWQRYQKKYGYASDIEWDKIIAALKRLTVHI